MSTLFQSYEEEYRDVVKSIQDGLTSLRLTLNRDNNNYKMPPATGPGSRLQRGAQLVTLIGQVKELLSNMEYESNDVPVTQRPILKEKLLECKKHARGLEEEIAKTRGECAAADRADLLGNSMKKGDNNNNNNNNNSTTTTGGGSGGLDEETAKHRLNMMQNTEKVKQASNTLSKAERLLNETEETGTEALRNLRSQTETLHRINATTISVNEEISEARKVLTRMQRTMIKHKIMLVGIIIVLLFLIFIAIYVSINKRGREKPLQPGEIPTSAPSLPSWNPQSGGDIPPE